MRGDRLLYKSQNPSEYRVSMGVKFGSSVAKSMCLTSARLERYEPVGLAYTTRSSSNEQTPLKMSRVFIDYRSNIR